MQCLPHHKLITHHQCSNICVCPFQPYPAHRSAVHYLARHNLLVRHQPHESVWAASKTPAEWELWVESYCFSDPDGSYRSPCLQVG